MSINHIFPLILVTREVKNILIMLPKWTGNSIRFVSNLFELKINRLLKQFSSFSIQNKLFVERESARYQYSCLHNVIKMFYYSAEIGFLNNYA